MTNGCLSLQDVMWRTVHGCAWLLSQQTKHTCDDPLPDFKADLKSVCEDVLKAEAIGFYTGFQVLKNNAIPSDGMAILKNEYRFLSDYMTKNEAGTVTQDNLADAFKSATSIIRYLKTFNNRCK